MIAEKVQDALNEQINRELYSSYLYLSMATCFKSMNLGGFAHWMELQAKEELTHAMKIYGYIDERGGRITLTAVAGPPSEWESLLAAFEAAYNHEQAITGHINDLVALAQAENDHATAVFLQWFVSEQVEEEASVDDVVQKLKIVGDSPSPLFMLDRALGQRE